MQVGCGLDYRGVTGSLLSQLSIWCTRCTCAFVHITGAKEPHNIERVLLFLPWHTSIEWSSATWLANKVMWHQKRTYLFHESGVCTCQCTHKIGQLSAYPLKWFPNNALWTSHCKCMWAEVTKTTHKLIFYIQNPNNTKNWKLDTIHLILI